GLDSPGELGARLLDARDALADGGHRGPLERNIEGGLQPEITRHWDGIPARQLRGNQVDEVRRGPHGLGKLARERTTNRLALRGGIDEAPLLHGDQNLIPPTLRFSA